MPFDRHMPGEPRGRTQPLSESEKQMSRAQSRASARRQREHRAAERERAPKPVDRRERVIDEIQTGPGWSQRFIFHERWGGATAIELQTISPERRTSIFFRRAEMAPIVAANALLTDLALADGRHETGAIVLRNGSRYVVFADHRGPYRSVGFQLVSATGDTLGRPKLFRGAARHALARACAELAAAT